MQDRVPLYPGRVKLTPVAGQANTYDMARADQPTQEGTPLNKSTLLTDAVASMFGLGTSAVPNDMFNVLTHAGDLHVWKRTIDGVTDYPVSPNRNAYQEGSDAKPAWYTLGEVQSGNFCISKLNDAFSQITWMIGSAIEVSDDGQVSLVNVDVAQRIGGTSDWLTVSKALIGKYAYPLQSGSFFNQNVVYYFPADADTSYDASSGTQRINISKYQAITGYPAIPAGTTIEYLGQLGDKERIETGSYVGTGTYGSGNPNKLEFDSKPEFLLVYNPPASDNVGDTGSWHRPLILISGFTGITNTGSNAWGSIISDWDQNSVSWYSNSAENQLNISGSVYAYIKI